MTAIPRKFQGIVYFIGNVENNCVKIGLTKDSSCRPRLGAIQTGCPFRLDILLELRCIDIDPVVVEKNLHKLFEHWRKRGEWFSISPTIEWFIQEAKTYEHEAEITISPMRYKEQSTGGYSSLQKGAWGFNSYVDANIFGAYGDAMGEIVAKISRGKSEETPPTVALLESALTMMMERNAHLAAAVDGFNAIAGRMDDMRSYYTEIQGQQFRAYHGRKMHRVLSDFINDEFASDAYDEVDLIVNQDVDDFRENALYAHAKDEAA